MNEILRNRTTIKYDEEDSTTQNTLYTETIYVTYTRPSATSLSSIWIVAYES